VFLKKFSLILRSSIFNFYIVLVLIIYGLIGAPLIIFKSKKILKFSKYWADAMLFGAKFFCGITYKIEGVENFPKEPSVIASKHQSAFECLVFLSLFPGICFILKKELLKIPIFGSYLKALEMISINRSNAKESIQIINKETKRMILEEKRFVLIFPEGTRVHHEAKSNCKPGIIFLHKANISDITPVWVNSGRFWGRNSFIKFPGEVTIRFLEKIDKNEDPKNIPNKLNELFDYQV
jgi:1-acyl-sn-glycerol-3-phosphate acyltransferase